MPENLCYSYSFSYPRYPFYDEKGSPTIIFCPFVTFSFYADEPLITKYQVDRAIHVDDWLSKEIISNYGEVVPDHVSEIAHYLIPVKISISDEVIGTKNGMPFRQWKHIIEGYLQRPQSIDAESAVIQPVVKGYSISAENQDNGSILFKVSIESACRNDDPVLLCQPGEDIEDVPGVPIPVTCNSYSCKDSHDEAGVYIWTVVYDCTGIYWPGGEQESTLPDDEVSVSYELNGTTVRTVDGELLVLRRSEYPILRKNIVTYSTSGSPLTVPGDSYKGGVALSESIIKETVTVDGSVKSSHYKHTIEVEGTGIDGTHDTGGGGEEDDS